MKIMNESIQQKSAMAFRFKDTETGFPKRFPQDLEVPPNSEVKQIVSPFSTLLSHSSNPALLKDDSKLLPFPGCWQAICKYDLHDTGHHRNRDAGVATFAGVWRMKMNSVFLKNGIPRRTLKAT